jgi:hypothetical protein
MKTPNAGGEHRRPISPTKNRPSRRPSKRDLSKRLDALEQTLKTNVDTVQQEANEAFGNLRWSNSQAILYNACLAQYDGRPFTPEESKILDEYWATLKSKYPRAFAHFHGKTLFPFDFEGARINVALNNFTYDETSRLGEICASGPRSPEDEALFKRLDEHLPNINPEGAQWLTDYYARKEALQNETRPPL